MKEFGISHRILIRLIEIAVKLILYLGRKLLPAAVSRQHKKGVAYARPVSVSCWFVADSRLFNTLNAGFESIDFCNGSAHIGTSVYFCNEAALTFVQFA